MQIPSKPSEVTSRLQIIWNVTWKWFVENLFESFIWGEICCVLNVSINFWTVVEWWTLFPLYAVDTVTHLPSRKQLYWLFTEKFIFNNCKWGQDSVPWKRWYIIELKHKCLQHVCNCLWSVLFETLVCRTQYAVITVSTLQDLTLTCHNSACLQKLLSRI